MTMIQAYVINKPNDTGDGVGWCEAQGDDALDPEERSMNPFAGAIVLDPKERSMNPFAGAIVLDLTGNLTKHLARNKEAEFCGWSWSRHWLTPLTTFNHETAAQEAQELIQDGVVVESEYPQHAIVLVRGGVSVHRVGAAGDTENAVFWKWLGVPEGATL